MLIINEHKCHALM